VVALAVWALVLLLLGVQGSGPAGVVWFAFGLLACLAGVAVAVGRARVGRGDTWQAAIVAVGASVLGPLSAALLLVPSVRRSLRNAPAQLRGEAREALADPQEQAAVGPPGAPASRWHTEEKAAVVHRRGVALALGLAAATLAFWSGMFISVWLAFASSTLTDGAGVALSLVVALIVGAVSFVAVLVVRRRPRFLAAVEIVAAVGMGAAIVCVALDGGDLNWSDGNRVSVSFLYVLWALIGILFGSGAAMARTRVETIDS
jgi:hypothetical protein